MNRWSPRGCRTGGWLPAGWCCPSPYALKDSRTQPETLRKGVELAAGTCSKGIISAFSLSGLSVASQLLKSSWRSSGSGRDSAMPLQCIPRRREMRRGWGRPHTLRYCWVFLCAVIPVTCLPLPRALAEPRPGHLWLSGLSVGILSH